MDKNNRPKCEKCGKFVAKTAVFCPHCNAILKERIEESEEELTIQNEEYQSDFEQTEQEVRQQSFFSSDTSEDQDYSLEEEYEEEYEEENEKEEEKKQKNLETDYFEPDDDETAFERLMGNFGQEESQTEKKKEKNNFFSSKGRKLFSSIQPKDSIKDEGEQKEGCEETKQSKKVEVSLEKRKEEMEEKINPIDQQRYDYDSNSDGYYDSIVALVDAKIEHITKENVIKTIGLATTAVLLIGFMVYFIL